MGTTATGGLLQSPVPALGSVNWAAATALSAGTSAFEASAFLLVASGIRTLNLSDAVALC
jgi:hypothetical protein